MHILKRHHFGCTLVLQRTLRQREAQPCAEWQTQRPCPDHWAVARWPMGAREAPRAHAQRRTPPPRSLLEPVLNNPVTQPSASLCCTEAVRAQGTCPSPAPHPEQGAWRKQNSSLPADALAGALGRVPPLGEAGWSQSCWPWQSWVPSGGCTQLVAALLEAAGPSGSTGAVVSAVPHTHTAWLGAL